MAPWPSWLPACPCGSRPRPFPEGPGKHGPRPEKGKGKGKGKRGDGDFSSEELQCLGYLGEGGFSRVFRGLLRRGKGPPVDVAIKPGVEELELLILGRLQAQRLPGVVPVWEAAHRTRDGEVALLGRGSLGTLGQALPRLRSAGALHERSFLALLANLADGLASLHGLQVIHCDPQPNNIVLHAEGAQVSLWLIDFGDARVLDHPEWWFIAGPGGPEVSCHIDFRRGQLSERTDSWGLAQCSALLWSWADHSWFSPGNPARLDEAMPLRQLLQGCLAREPQERPSASEVAASSHRQLAALGTSAGAELSLLAKHLA